MKPHKRYTTNAEPTVVRRERDCVDPITGDAILDWSAYTEIESFCGRPIMVEARYIKDDKQYGRAHVSTS